MDDLSFTDMLDIGWAHLLEIASSGAFTNPFEVRAQMRHIVWGYEAPPAPEKERRQPGSPPTKVVLNEATRQDLREAREHFEKMKAASLAEQ